MSAKHVFLTSYYTFFVFNGGIKNALKLWQMLRVPVVLLGPNFPSVAFP
jgi:hypothetical protein